MIRKRVNENGRVSGSESENENGNGSGGESERVGMRVGVRNLS